MPIAEFLMQNFATLVAAAMGGLSAYLAIRNDIAAMKAEISIARDTAMNARTSAERAHDRIDSMKDAGK